MSAPTMIHTAPVTSALPSRLDHLPVSPVPLARLVRVEVRKGIDTRAGRWVLIGIGILTLLVMGLTLYTAEAADRNLGSLIESTYLPQSLLLPILGILIVTAEWSQRTGLVTFTLEPHRARVAWAKVVAALVIGAAAVGAAIVLSVAVVGLDGVVRGSSPDWTLKWQNLLGVVIAQLLGVAMGAAIGMILQNTPASIVTFFLLPTVWMIATTSVSWMKVGSEWLDTSTTMQPLFDASMQGDDWAKLAVSLFAWVVVPLVAGMWRLRHSEVK